MRHRLTPQVKRLTSISRIGEKFQEWTDTTPPLDTILTNVSLYWFTQGFPRSIYPYREIFREPRIELPYLKKPSGFSFFPVELFPGIESLVKNQCELVHYKQHQKGGHFAALEQPKELWGDVEAYVAKAWKV